MAFFYSCWPCKDRKNGRSWYKLCAPGGKWVAQRVKQQETSFSIPGKAKISGLPSKGQALRWQPRSRYHCHLRACYHCHLRACMQGFKDTLTLLSMAFYDFLSYGGGILCNTPENNGNIILLIWSLVHIINGIRILRLQNFRKFTDLLLEIWRHKLRVFTRERFIAFRCLPPGFVFNDAKITFLLSKMIFVT